MIYIINLGKRLEYVKMGENTRLNGNKNKLSESCVIRKFVRQPYC